MATRWIIAVGGTLVGVVWIAQGLSLLPGSGFMSGDPVWTLIGAILVAVGVAIGVSAWRARRST